MSTQIIAIIIQLITLVMFLNSVQSRAQSGCQIMTSQGRISAAQNDEFFKLIVKTPVCAQNIESVSELLNEGFQNRKFLVANRGRNNPKLGSFSVFESFSAKSRAAEAGIFLGHFTKLKNANGKPVIDLDQAPDQGKLVIELIAWDTIKGYYNFYELIGQGTFNQWFYRGDSKDILKDNQAIYLNNSPQKPPFGQTLRCSGCHISGGPIMKEMVFPHNDWWIKSRILTFANPQSQSFLQTLRALDTAENLSALVQAGIQKLENSAGYQNIKMSLGVRAQLRPLFCDLEINIESDVGPSETGLAVQIPSNSIAGPFLGAFKLYVPKSAYSGLLEKYRMQFPENGMPDADHAWLTPVKGYSDLVAIGKLKMSGLVDDKTILDLYFSAPIGTLMNKERCELLKLVPNTLDWKTGFLQNLQNQNSPVAKNLLQKMNNKLLTPSAYQHSMSEWYRQTNLKINKGDMDACFRQLIANRQTVFASEISKNPMGQILEPGFRVIFPQPHVSFR